MLDAAGQWPNLDDGLWDLNRSCPVPFGPRYLDDHASAFCVVDDADRDWALRWNWRLVWSNRWRTTPKPYVTRVTNKPGTSKTKGNNINLTIYMHVEICTMAWGPPPNSWQILADHKDGNSFNNRRSNLRWASYSQNRRNLFGACAEEERALAMGSTPPRFAFDLE